MKYALSQRRRMRGLTPDQSLVNASSGIFTTSLGLTGRRPSLLEDALVEVDHCPPLLHAIVKLMNQSGNCSAIRRGKKSLFGSYSYHKPFVV
ncbi:hypothetical protein AVEN_123251-1 [Araneus ventricosus]|uniref:Uncharacterized protein n=1 Tax=Araneus ventricosus TaxID=182803 RepID=A0A4Y1ZLU8_ARAVE|nr:hypothetical protein AVEN_123251-1 [Araneus ventricosus]